VNLFFFHLGRRFSPLSVIYIWLVFNSCSEELVLLSFPSRVQPEFLDCRDRNGHHPSGRTFWKRLFAPSSLLFSPLGVCLRSLSLRLNLSSSYFRKYEYGPRPSSRDSLQYKEPAACCLVVRLRRRALSHLPFSLLPIRCCSASIKSLLSPYSLFFSPIRTAYAK